jgi:hypothetical protein
MSHDSSPFCFGYFGKMVSLFGPGQPVLYSSFIKFPCIVGMTDVHHHAKLFLLRCEVLLILLPG